jgi:hypothetical protein
LHLTGEAPAKLISGVLVLDPASVARRPETTDRAIREELGAQDPNLLV